MDPIVGGLMLMGYGLGGVFLALIIFYLSIRVLTALFREKKDKKHQESV